MGSLITVLVVIALVALIVWALTTFLPIDPKFKQLIIVVAIVFLLLYILKALGLWSGSFG
jgi:hypothetical protein